MKKRSRIFSKKQLTFRAASSKVQSFFLQIDFRSGILKRLLVTTSKLPQGKKKIKERMCKRLNNRLNNNEISLSFFWEGERER